MFEVMIRRRRRVICETVRPLRNVTAKCYGGDITGSASSSARRKAKARMKQLGRAIPRGFLLGPPVLRRRDDAASTLPEDAPEVVKVEEVRNQRRTISSHARALVRTFVVRRSRSPRAP
jgi:hypothetical protein